MLGRSRAQAMERHVCMIIVNTTKSTGHEQRRDLLGLLRFMKKWRALGDAGPSTPSLIFSIGAVCVACVGCGVSMKILKITHNISIVENLALCCWCTPPPRPWPDLHKPKLGASLGCALRGP